MCEKAKYVIEDAVSCTGKGTIVQTIPNEEVSRETFQPFASGQLLIVKSAQEFRGQLRDLTLGGDARGCPTLQPRFLWIAKRTEDGWEMSNNVDLGYYRLNDCRIGRIKSPYRLGIEDNDHSTLMLSDDPDVILPAEVAGLVPTIGQLKERVQFLLRDRKCPSCKGSGGEMCHGEYHICWSCSGDGVYRPRGVELELALLLTWMLDGTITD